MSEPPGPGERLTVVEDETGEIRIGPIPVAPAGIATVPVQGGTVYIDPSRPESPPAAVIADPARATEALERIFGEEAAGAVRSAERPTTFPVVATDAAARLARLGILRWLGSTCPFPLDQGLLMLETAVASAACSDVLDCDDEMWPTLEDLGDAVVALAWTVREGGTDALPVGLTDLLEDALNGLVLGLGPDDPLAETARHESELRDAMTAFAIDRLDWSRWAELAAQARPDAAAHAGALGAPDGPAQAGTASVDWTRVPAGLLDPGEGTVDWSAHPVGDDRIRVEVSVRARGLAGDGFRLADWLDRADESAAAALRRLSGRTGDNPALRFRLYVPGFGLPVATGALARSADGARWEGSAEVAERAMRPGILFVDIHAAGAPGPRRNGEVAAEAGRWAARGLGLLRLSIVGTVSADDVRGPLERARQLFAQAADTATNGNSEASLGLRRSLARCDALIAAHMTRSGAGRAVERRRTKAVGGDLFPGDTQLPDLASSLWLPTVTERALLQGTGIDD